MIDLRPNCVAQFKMNDDAANPYIVNSIVGPPTELVQNNFFDVDASDWTLEAPWVWSAMHGGSVWFNGIGSPYKYLHQNVGYVAGRKYVYAHQIPDMYDPFCSPSVGNTPGTPQSVDGSYAEALICSDGSAWEPRISFEGYRAAFHINNIFSFDLDTFPLTGVFRGAFDGNPRTSAHSVVGKIGKAIHFDGINDYGIVFNEGALNFTTQSFTIVIWFKRNRTGDIIEYLLSRGLVWVDGWVLYLDNDLIVFGGSADVLISATTVNDTNWHKLVVIKDGANSGLFLDNVECAYLLGPPLDNTTSSSRALKIGCDDAYANKFQGDIDVTAFFNKALSQAERDMVWHGGKGTERLISLHHHIYRGQDGSIDYSSPAAEMELDDSQVTIPVQALPANTIWHYIRRQIDDECGLESDDSPACIVAIDSNGDMIGSTPNPPISLTIERLSNGRFHLRWRYTRLSEEVTPTGFKIYMDSGSGFNFSSPDATIAYGIGGINNEFSWISGALTHGQIYRFCIRSYRTGEGESQNTDYVATDADSEGPAAITNLQASYEEI